MSKIAILLPSKQNAVAFNAFPVAYDHIMKYGKPYVVTSDEYKGISIGENLYTAGVYQRYTLCIRHYGELLDPKYMQTWREDDMLLIDKWFNPLLNVLFLHDFHMVCIKK